MPELKRRGFLVNAAALIATPAFAQSGTQSDPWDASVRQARAHDQCRALFIQMNGKEVVAEVFRGPAMGRAVQIKSGSKTLVAALMGAALNRGI